MFHRKDRKIKSRITCALFTMLLAAGNVFAEDDIIEIEPNGVIGALNSLWQFLAGLF